MNALGKKLVGKRCANFHFFTVGAFNEATISWENTDFIEGEMENDGEINKRCI